MRSLRYVWLVLMVELQRGEMEVRALKWPLILIGGITVVTLALTLWFGRDAMPDDAFPRVDIVRLDTVITTFAPELAVTGEQLTRGLMGRDHLAPGTGMLFIFPQTGDHGMWMPNMLISLDFLFADASGTIVHLASDVPPCVAGEHCPTISAGTPTVKYVFEIPAGSIARHGIQKGDKLRLLLSPSAEE